MQNNKIYSKYSYSDYYLISGSNSHNIFGILIKMNKNNKKLLKESEYFKIEKQISYSGIYRDLMYDISDRHNFINNVFDIGTTKMCRILNNLSRTYKHARILKLLYNLEKLKMDNQYSNYYRSRKFQMIKKYINELNDYLDIKVNKHHILNKYEYLINFEGYIFSYHYDLIDNKYKIESENYKYNIQTPQMGKLMDLIWDKFGKYMK